MPEFRIKNLMVDVVSALEFPDVDKLCRWPTQFCGVVFTKCFKYISRPCLAPSCRVPSLDCLPCSQRITMCQGACSFISPIVEDCPGRSLVACPGGSEILVIDIHDLLINPELVQEVQVELEQVMKAVQERGVALNKAMAPQTKAQAEALEKELEVALEEIKRLKGTLK